MSVVFFNQTEPTTCLAYFPNIITEVLSYLTHGDCGRLFFVSKKWRNELLEPSRHHFVLRKHRVLVRMADAFTPNQCIQCRFPWNCCIEAVALLQSFIKKGWIEHPFLGYHDLALPKGWCGWFLALRHGSFLTALHLGMDTYMLTLRDIYPISMIFPMNHFYDLDPFVVAQWLMRYNKLFDFEGALQWARVPIASWKNVWDVMALMKKYRPDLLVCSRDFKHTLVMLSNLGSKPGHKETFKIFTDHLQAKYGLTMAQFHIDTFNGEQLAVEACDQYKAFEREFRHVECLYNLE